MPKRRRSKGLEDAEGSKSPGWMIARTAAAASVRVTATAPSCHCPVAATDPVTDPVAVPVTAPVTAPAAELGFQFGVQDNTSLTIRLRVADRF